MWDVLSFFLLVLVLIQCFCCCYSFFYYFLPSQTGKGRRKSSAQTFSSCYPPSCFLSIHDQESLEAVRSVEGNVKCVVVHAGRLFGAARGEEPVPFLTGPKAEPVLDESITRQAVLVGPGTVLSSVSSVRRFSISFAKDVQV